ncbi:MAG: hypothetical protein N2515_10160 [Deltaproteobacteria bacterium]|nr:hypothetical protein [Deltaproteobacteria bacterium]
MTALAQSRARGSLFPPIELESSHGKQRLVFAPGRVTLAFYESKEAVWTNLNFKEKVRLFGLAHAPLLDFLAIGDVSKFNFEPARRAVRAFVSHFASSRKIELVLDWEGALQKPPYGLQPGHSHIVLVDHLGHLIAHHIGNLSEGEGEAIFAQINRALHLASPRGEALQIHLKQ